MNPNASVGHLKNIVDNSFHSKREFHDVWNDWAKKLMDERDWDDDKKKYHIDEYNHWGERANIEFDPKIFDSQFTEGNFFINDGIADFSKCVFPGNVKLTSSPLMTDFNFSDAQFIQDVNFKMLNQTLFRKQKHSVDLTGACIYGNSNFSGSTFVNKGMFSKIKTYGDIVDFSNCTFQTSAEFMECEFHSTVDFMNCVFEDHVNLDRAKFYSLGNFTAIQSKRALSMMDTTFDVTPDFTSFRFDHHPYINSMTVKEQTKLIEKVKKKKENYRDDLKEEIRKLQALKAIAIQAHDHENELKFFAKEMQCKELELSTVNEETKGGSFPVILASWLNLLPYQAYSYISNYGQSVVQPIKVWSSLFGLSWSIYFLASIFYTKLACVNLGKAAYLSFLHNLPLLGLWRTENHQNTVKSLFTDHNLAWDIIFILQNITAGLIIFLLFQAIRNRFKIK